MDESMFARAFRALTGHAPFPWQSQMFELVRNGRLEECETCTLPTGLGKTAVIPVWLIALAESPRDVPRRLVYVVNRRTVVDQTTNEVEQLRRALESSQDGELAKLRDRLNQLRGCSEGAGILSANDPPLAISTLRGQFADNREWSADPARPAVIVGTVDMIGSRLLFSGYGVGFRARPLHAGFLGQDSLIVHDEAHLEPAFQHLIETIRNEQSRCRDFRPTRVVQLTATTRNGTDKRNGEEQGGEGAFELTDFEKNPPDELPDPPTEPIHHVWRRLRAKKKLTLHRAGDGKDAVATEIARLAAACKNSSAAVLVFIRTLDDIGTVEKELAKTKRDVVLLTGTMRGLERDRMAKSDPVFMRFLPAKNRNPDVTPAEDTVYLVCTGAGEVGIDISADHMVCDLSTFESMAQRFGRVNRYGDRNDTRIDVVYPAEFDDKDKLKNAREATLRLLQELNGNASPLNLDTLDSKKRSAAFAPEPTIIPATDILFDAWALTTIREKMPGRPPVEPYLHGIAEWQPPETHVAWREEVAVITDDLLDRYPPADLLDEYALKPHELLRDRSDRVFKHVEALAKRHGDKPVWVMDDREAIEVTTLAELADKRRKDRIEKCTVLLPPTVGGLSGGMLDGLSEQADDVADAAVDERGRLLRQRAWDDDDVPSYLRRIRTINTRPDAEDDEADEGSVRQRFWHWYELPREGGRTSICPVKLCIHVGDVVNHAKQIISGLSLPQEIADAVILAAKLHDHGKRRERFQIALGNADYPNILLAKSGRKGARLPEPFRHEFASVLDALADAEFSELDNEMKDLLLHLVAAHHGRARPHFTSDEAFDPDRPLSDAKTLAIETPRRFARLQRKYGRWGLAYLESLLRAADWAASANPSPDGNHAEDKQ